MQLGNGIYGTVLDPLIDYSGQTNLFATIINFERMWKSLIYTHHLQQKVFHYGLAWVLKKVNRKPYINKKHKKYDNNNNNNLLMT